MNLDEVKTITENWRIDYNQTRPHSSLNYLTPAAFAKQVENGAIPPWGDQGQATAKTKRPLSGLKRNSILS